jgi:hypothetical protein
MAVMQKRRNACFKGGNISSQLFSAYPGMTGLKLMANLEAQC